MLKLGVFWILIFLSFTTSLSQIGPTAQKERDERLQQDINSQGSGGGNGFTMMVAEGIFTLYLANQRRQHQRQLEREAQQKFAQEIDRIVGKSVSILNKGQDSLALSTISDAILAYPDQADLWACRGYINYFQQSPDPKAARNDLSEAFRLSPESANTNSILAYIEFSEENYESALVAANASLAKQSNNTLSIWIKAKVHEKLDQYIQAIQAFNRLISLNPDYPDVFLLRGVCHFNHQKYQAALIDMSQTIGRSPQDFKGYYYRGRIYSYQEQWDMALRYHSLAIEKSPELPIVWTGRAEVYYNMGEYELALTDIENAELVGSAQEKTSIIRQQLNEAYYLKGMILLDKG